MWTGALLLDATGDPGRRRAAQTLVGAGVLAVAPTAATGLADWSELGLFERPKRVGLVHALLNVVTAGLYAASWSARRRGDQSRGTALALIGAGTMAASGYLGGHLSYSQGVGVNRNADVAPERSTGPTSPRRRSSSRRACTGSTSAASRSSSPPAAVGGWPSTRAAATTGRRWTRATSSTRRRPAWSAPGTAARSPSSTAGWSAGRRRRRSSRTTSASRAVACRYGSSASRNPGPAARPTRAAVPRSPPCPSACCCSW